MNPSKRNGDTAKIIDLILTPQEIIENITFIEKMKQKS